MHLQSNFAIVAGSVLEDMLAEALRVKMRDGLSARLKERLFSGYGPLSSFSGKIDIAFAFSYAQKLTGWANGCDVDALFKERFSACASAIKEHLATGDLINALKNYKRTEATE
jgi:hypothetical protein